jgi:hypothetical protein
MLALYLLIYMFFFGHLCFTSNHTGRDSDTMLPLYMQDEMYRKSLLLGHRSEHENGNWEFDRGTLTCSLSFWPVVSNGGY